MSDVDEMEKETIKAFKNPKVGMRFHEMCSWWVYIVSMKDGVIITRSHGGHPANPIGESIEYERYPSAEAFRKRFKASYGSAYTVYYSDDKAYERMSKEVIVTTEELTRDGFNAILNKKWRMK